MRFLLGEVDVQANRFVVLVLGFGIGESGQLERWVVDSFTLRTSKREDGSGGFLPLDPPKYLEDWERLVEKVISALPAGRCHRPQHAGACGGYRLGRQVGHLGARAGVLAFAQGPEAARQGQADQGRRAPRGWPVPGDLPGQQQAPGPQIRVEGDVPQLLLNVDRLKDTVDANIKRAEPGRATTTFPTGCPKRSTRS